MVDIASEYPEYMKAFSKALADQLPSHWDPEILLIKGAKLLNGITCEITLEEEKTHRKSRNLRQGQKVTIGNCGPGPICNNEE